MASSLERRKNMRPSDNPCWQEASAKLGPMTLEELSAWAEAKDFPDNWLLISDVMLYWWRYETAEETIKRLDKEKKAHQSHEKWERDTLVRLLDKYGLPEGYKEKT